MLLVKWYINLQVPATHKGGAMGMGMYMYECSSAVDWLGSIS